MGLLSARGSSFLCTLCSVVGYNKNSNLTPTQTRQLQLPSTCSGETPAPMCLGQVSPPLYNTPYPKWYAAPEHGLAVMQWHNCFITPLPKCLQAVICSYEQLIFGAWKGQSTTKYGMDHDGTPTSLPTYVNWGKLPPPLLHYDSHWNLWWGQSQNSLRGKGNLHPLMLGQRSTAQMDALRCEPALLLVQVKRRGKEEQW